MASRERKVEMNKTKCVEIIEGREAFTNFDSLVGSVLSVPRSVIQQREAEYKKQAALNPHKRGPKKKASSRARESA